MEDESLQIFVTHQPPKPSRVPPTLRGLVARVGRRGPLSRLGTRAYRVIAACCAERLLRVDGVEGVSLRGGAVRRCVPGISDIDLVVFVDRLFPSERSSRTLATLREISVRARRQFLILGELMVTDRESWEALLTCQYSSIFMGTELANYDPMAREWVPMTSDCEGISPLARLSAAIHHYYRAIVHCASWIENRGRAFDWACFSKEASRAIDCAQGNTITVRWEASPESLLAGALFEIDLLARRVLAIPERQVTDIEMELKNRWLPGDEMLRRSQARGKGFDLFAKNQFMLQPTPVPFLFIPAGLSSRDEMTELFSKFLKFLSEKGRSPFSRLFLPFSSAMLACFLQRGLWKNPLQNLSWVDDSRQRDVAWLDGFKAHHFDILGRRCLTHWTKLPSELMSEDSRSLRERCRELCVEALALKTRCLTQDWRDLVRRNRRTLPKTSRLLKRLHEEPFAGSRAELERATLDVWVEIKELFRNHSSIS